MNYIATVISNRSNGYIHLYWTGPPAFASNDRCIGRCSIESKNDGGNIISSLHSVSMIFAWSLSMWSTFNLLEHISLKKWLISVSASHIPFGNKSQKANGMSVCINTHPNAHTTTFSHNFYVNSFFFSMSKVVRIYHPKKLLAVLFLYIDFAS